MIRLVDDTGAADPAPDRNARAVAIVVDLSTDSVESDAEVLASVRAYVGGRRSIAALITSIEVLRVRQPALGAALLADALELLGVPRREG